VLYVVSIPFAHSGEIDPNTRDSKDEVSRKCVAWKIRGLENSTCATPTHSCTSWWSAPLLSRW